jgi:hypothetical protein
LTGTARAARGGARRFTWDPEFREGPARNP